MSIVESLATYEADQHATTDGHRVTLRRAYMAGAQEMLAQLNKGAKPQDLQAQLLAWARGTIGRPVERAA